MIFCGKCIIILKYTNIRCCCGTVAPKDFGNPDLCGKGVNVMQKKKGGILIVDDEKINRSILRKILSDDYAVLEAENGRQGVEMLDRKCDSVLAIVLDLMMPVMDGWEFLRLYHQNEKFRKVPVLVATAAGDLESEKRCLSLGAWDFVSKPYDADVLKFRLKNAIDRSQLSLMQELRYLAEHDPLTGIYNKNQFFLRTREMLDENPDTLFAFARFDIVRFQLVNTLFGIAEGNKLLRYIAGMLERYGKTHPLFTYGRLGDDIFGACFPFLKEDGVIRRLSDIRDQLGKYRLDFDIVPNVGVYVISDPSEEIGMMYDRAALAAKQYKGSYIQNCTFYTDQMEKTIVRDQNIVNNMRQALKEEQFVIYYQPRYDLRNMQVDGAEALVRWKNAQGEMILPGEFIPVFERNGFILQLDFYVWEHVCVQMRKWIDEGRDPHPISVNISRVSLRNPRLADLIIDLMGKYRIPPRLLQLEILESAYISDPQTIRNTVSRFQGKGISVLMDDFGSGYSSLNVLKDIEVDTLKIDMAFLSGSESKPGRGENILASVVRMAKWLDMPTIAEGVEKAEQVNFLRNIGCEYAQGYYFARPMPAEDYEKLAFGTPRVYREERCRGMTADQLWETTSQMENLFANMLQAVAIYEFEGSQVEILRVNDAYYDLYGYGDLNRESGGFLAQVAPAHRPVVINAFEVVASTQGMAECDFCRTLESGRTVWVRIKLKYVQAIGTKHVIFGGLEDITAQKKIYDELSRYRSAMQIDSGGERILIVDDMEVNRTVLRSIFEDQYTILEAVDGQDAIRVLNEAGTVDIILLDLQMPGMNGDSFLRYLRSRAELAGIPVVIIAADDSPRQQTDVLALGASDYIVKPFITETVRRRVCNVLESRRWFCEAIRGYYTTLEQAPRDDLTGVYSCEAAPCLMDTVLRTSEEISTPESLQALLMVNITNLSRINETCGRAAGDAVLRNFAHSLRACFRRSDVIARHGGPEFTVLMTNVPSERFVVERCGQLILEARKRREPAEVECAVGVVLSGRGTKTVKELIQHASAALFQAKQQGCDQIVVHFAGGGQKADADLPPTAADQAAPES